MLSDGIDHRQHAVDWRLESSSQLPHHHVGELPIAPKQYLRTLLGLRAHDLAKLHDGLAARQRVRRHRRRRQSFIPAQVALWQPDTNLNWVPFLAAVRISDGNAAEQRLHSVVDIALFDAKYSNSS